MVTSALLLLFPLLIAFVPISYAQLITDPSQRFDLNRLKWDDRPVWWMVGQWGIEFPKNGEQLWNGGYPYPDLMDFAISSVPMFGARTLNYTGSVYDTEGKVVYFESGYVPVKNISTRDNTYPHAKLALLTASNRGYTTLEEGIAYQNNHVYLNLTTFLKRSFDDYQMNLLTLRREFFIQRDRLFHKMTWGFTDGTTGTALVTYLKKAGWPCAQGCRLISQQDIPDACTLCA